MDSTIPVLETTSLSKTFRDFWMRPRVRAVQNLSLRVDRGEVLGLLGPNGSGKSTTIKMILGLLRPSAGGVRVFGLPAAHPAVRARVGYLPEVTTLYRHLTPRETLGFFGALFDLPRAERRRRVAELLRMVGLEEAADRAVGEFSKGMARRVGLAQALVNDPDFIVLDEPTSGLDPIGRHQVKTLIRQLADRGKTILLSSHLLSEVADVCDRVAVLYRGRLQATGRIDELLARRQSVRLTFPAPADDAALPRLVAAVSAETGATPAVDHPAMTLEEYFLGIIARADGIPAEEPVLAPFLAGRAPEAEP